MRLRHRLVALVEVVDLVPGGAGRVEPGLAEVILQLGVGAVEGREGHVRGRLDDGVRLGVQPHAAVGAVAHAELLASHGNVAVGAVAQKHRVGARPCATRPAQSARK